MSKLTLIIAIIMLAWLLIAHPNHEEIHRVAWQLGLTDVILVGASMYLTSGH